MLKRLVTTSRGPVEIEVSQDRSFGTRVALTTFAADGWEEESAMWSSRWGHDSREQTLSEFLAAHADLPEPEAAQLSEEVLGPWLEEWLERGGQEEAQELESLMRIVLVVISVVAVLALVGLVTLVVLVINRV